MARLASWHDRIQGRTAHLSVVGFVMVLLLVGIVLFMLHITMVDRTLDLADELADRTDSTFATIPSLTNREKQQLRSHLNKQHVETARTLGIRSISDRTVAAQLADAGNLHRLVDNRYYVVEPMEYSVPYVTHSTAHLLDLIGATFQEALRREGLPPYRYVITSATRSQADQRALRRVNANAARESSHHYGTTVDLHYRSFVYTPRQDDFADVPGIIPSLLKEKLATAYANLGEAHHARLEALLGRVLLELQADGKVLVIYERRQPVFHITTADQIMPPAASPPSGALGP